MYLVYGTIIPGKECLSDGRPITAGELEWFIDGSKYEEETEGNRFSV